MIAAQSGLIIYDGSCGLCNWFVRFLLRIENKEVLFFTASAGETAAKLQKEHGIPLNDYDSVFLVEKSKSGYRYSIRSAAVLRTVKKLGLPWNLLYGFIVVPRFLRDWIYDLVAKNRRKLSSKNLTCSIDQPIDPHRQLP